MEQLIVIGIYTMLRLNTGIPIWVIALTLSVLTFLKVNSIVRDPILSICSEELDKIIEQGGEVLSLIWGGYFGSWLIVLFYNSLS